MAQFFDQLTKTISSWVKKTFFKKTPPARPFEVLKAAVLFNDDAKVKELLTWSNVREAVRQKVAGKTIFHHLRYSTNPKIATLLLDALPNKEDALKLLLQPNNGETALEFLNRIYVSGGRDNSQLIKAIVNYFPPEDRYTLISQSGDLLHVTFSHGITGLSDFYLTAVPPEKMFALASAAAKMSDGTTPLHHLVPLYSHARPKASEVITQFLSHFDSWHQDALINIQDDSGNTPLHKALNRGCEEIAKQLVQAGGESQIPNDNKNTPLHLAADYNVNIRRGGFLDNMTPDEINQKNIDGKTALMFAAEKADDKVDNCEWLIFNGAKVDITDNNLRTPLHLVMLSKAPDYIKLNRAERMIMSLKGEERKNWINLPDANGKTALDLVVEGKRLAHPRIFNCLVEAGAIRRSKVSNERFTLLAFNEVKKNQRVAEKPTDEKMVRRSLRLGGKKE